MVICRVITRLHPVPMAKDKQIRLPVREQYFQYEPRAMVETTITARNLSSPCAPASNREEGNHRVERNLVQCCVQRRLGTYSQLPVRCHKISPYYRPPRLFKLQRLAGIGRTSPINTAKSCPDSLPCSSLLRTIGTTPRCKKSLSMIDLSPVADPEAGDLRSESSSTLERSEASSDKARETSGNDAAGKIWPDGFLTLDSEDGSSRFAQNPRKAAAIVSRMLMLNAWRRRRVEAVDLRESIDGLNQQVERSHLQIIVLRRLVDTEYNRVGVLTTEVHRVRAQLEEAQREKDSLKTEKERLEEELKRSAELSEERLVAAENLRNQLQTARDQIRALDEQISRDREKLLKLREEKRTLLDKVSASDAVATERKDRAEKVESVAEDLQLKLATQTALAESSQEKIKQYTKELKIREEQRAKLERILKSAEEAARALHMRVGFLESQLADREATLHRVETACNLQSMELNDLRQRLVRQPQEGSWSNRMLQIAGTVVRAPRAILRTLSFLSSVNPSLTS